jgi:hypothetical protein
MSHLIKKLKKPRFKPHVGIWRKSQGNRAEIHGVADTVKKYITPDHNLEKKITKKPDKFKASQRKNSIHTAS